MCLFLTMQYRRSERDLCFALKIPSVAVVVFVLCAKKEEKNGNFTCAKIFTHQQLTTHKVLFILLRNVLFQLHKINSQILILSQDRYIRLIEIVKNTIGCFLRHNIISKNRQWAMCCAAQRVPGTGPNPQTGKLVIYSWFF